MLMTTLAIYSNKGGVGKTAAAVNLSYLAAQSGAKTLICDLDPQSSATYYFRVKPRLKAGAKSFIKGGRQVYKSVKGTDYENLDLLPADFSLRNLDIAFDKAKRSKKRLGKMLHPFKAEYDYIFLDCPVTISMLAENILNAADYVLVPVIPTTLSVRTYKQLLSFCNKNDYHSGKMFIFFSMVDRRKKMHRDIIPAVSKAYNGVFRSVIPYLAKVEKMGIYRAPIAAFSPDSTASRAYQNVWTEVQKNLLSVH
jgi:cellulose biosynthesis protein BcsQ